MKQWLGTEKLCNWLKAHPIVNFITITIMENMIWLFVTNWISMPYVAYLFIFSSNLASKNDYALFREQTLVSLSFSIKTIGIVLLLIGTLIYFVMQHSRKRCELAEANAINWKKKYTNNLVNEDQIKTLNARLLELKPRIELNRLVDLLSQFTNESEIVESIQLYEHSELPNPKNVSANSFIDISFKFLDGTAAKDANVNALLHIRYQLGSDIYYPLYHLFADRNAYYAQHQRSSNATQEHDIQAKAISLFTDISKILNKLTDVSEIRDIHYAYYRILEMLATIVIAKEELVECKKLLEYSGEIESQLKRGQRTGLLGTLFMESMYYFGNENSFSKKNRCYFTAPLNYKGRKMIMVVVLQKNKLRLGPNQKELECCKEIYDEINQLLTDTLSERRTV